MYLFVSVMPNAGFLQGLLLRNPGMITPGISAIHAIFPIFRTQLGDIMETENSFNPSQEGIDAGRRSILRSIPGLGVGIIAPTGIFTASMLAPTSAMADTLTLIGELRTDTAYPTVGYLTTNGVYNYVNVYKFWKKSGTSYTYDSNITQVRQYVNGNLTCMCAVRTQKDSAGKWWHSFWDSLTISSDRITLTYPGTPRRHLKGGAILNPDSDAVVAKSISSVSISVPTNYTKTVDEHYSARRYVRASRNSNVTTGTPFYNRGVAYVAHADGTDKHKFVRTTWFASNGTSGKYAELKNIWDDNQTARSNLITQASLTAVTTLFSACNYLQAYKSTEPTMDAKFSYFPPAILASSLYVGVATFGSAMMTAAWEVSSQYKKYVTFVEANAYDTGEI